MTAPEKWTEESRDKTHDLDLRLPEHQAIYEHYLKTYIMQNEVIWQYDLKDPKNPIPIKPIVNLEAYDDNAKPPRRTVGIGFNMDRPEARKEWEKVLKNVSFDDVYSGKLQITGEQATMLFDYSIKVRRQELISFFGEDNWSKLTANERITIEDMYYRSPKLVMNYDKVTNSYYDTNFSKNVKLY